MKKQEFEMQSRRIREVSDVCFSGCCSNPFHNLPDNQNSASRSTKNRISPEYDFIAATCSSVQPNNQFTNHESLPSLAESYSYLNKAYPLYSKTNLADKIRTEEYYHLSLSNHVCLDYIGHGLFSYSQQQIQASAAAEASTSSSPPLPRTLSSSTVHLFSISHKNVSLTSQLLHGGQESEFESSMRKKIMKFMNISEDDYSMIFTANQSSAFRLLADCYPFQSNHNLLTVYDFKNEAMEAMTESSKTKGARIISAEFSWPNFRIQSRKLRKMIESRSKKRTRGLFVFPLQSRMTGARYSYQWMSLARDNGWHVLLDASALGAKDMETLGLSLFQPEFLVSSFFKVFGKNPFGFSCLFVKKSSISLLEKSSTNMGIVSLVLFPKLSEDSSCTDEESLRQMLVMDQNRDVMTEPSSSYSAVSFQQKNEDPSEMQEIRPNSRDGKEPFSIEIEVFESTNQQTEASENGSRDIECRGLDHADTLGLILISSRGRFLINWLINALMSLRHPHSENGLSLVKIYGPKVKFDRGTAVAFNIYDWKAEKVDPSLVQKLADRNNISVSCGFLQNIWFSDIYEEERKRILEFREKKGDQKQGKCDAGISVITASLGFLTNFEDVYRVWAFVSRFLDADYVEKERWRYKALNQSTVEL